MSKIIITGSENINHAMIARLEAIEGTEIIIVEADNNLFLLKK